MAANIGMLLGDQLIKLVVLKILIMLKITGLISVLVKVVLTARTSLV